MSQIEKVREIPDPAKLFHRISLAHVRHSNYEIVEDSIVQSGDDGLSMIWEAYISAEEVISSLKPPERAFKTAVISFIASEIRASKPKMDVIHRPTKDNPGHSIIPDFKNKGENQVNLFRILKLEIPFSREAIEKDYKNIMEQLSKKKNNL